MRISKIKDVKTPGRGTKKSAGLDFYVPNDFVATTVLPKTSIKIESGIRVNIPENHVLIAFNKSGIALSGLQVGACVIDEDYQGEVNIHLFNVTDKEIQIIPGQKLVQFLLLPINYSEVETVEDENLFSEVTERGTGGFGSTGLK